jgi:hypothetical protein
MNPDQKDKYFEKRESLSVEWEEIKLGTSYRDFHCNGSTFYRLIVKKCFV